MRNRETIHFDPFEDIPISRNAPVCFRFQRPVPIRGMIPHQDRCSRYSVRISTMMGWLDSFFCFKRFDSGLHIWLCVVFFSLLLRLSFFWNCHLIYTNSLVVSNTLVANWGEKHHMFPNRDILPPGEISLCSCTLFCVGFTKPHESYPSLTWKHCQCKAVLGSFWIIKPIH